MKEFIEKLIGRLEEQRGHICNCMPCNGCKYIGDCNEGEFAEDVALDKAIEIVNQLAEEYNNESVKGDLISKGELKKSLEKITVTINWDDVNKIKDDEQFIESIIHNCTEIVMRHIDEQPATENNGWIPCSERLPKDDSICIVTVEYPNNETVVDYGWFDRIGICWYVGMQEFRTSNILAWQPLPASYQPKGE